MRRAAWMLVAWTALSGCTEVSIRESAVCDGEQQSSEATVDAPFDQDGDGFFDASNPDCAGFWDVGRLDCDDADASVHPGAEDPACDGVDQDCDGSPEDAEDADGDGSSACEDCDDADAAVHPGADEIACNDLDDDCDADTPDGLDADGDGFDCDDCDDANDEVHPAAAEVGCNDLDDDCDVATPDAVDADGDGAACDDCDDTEPASFPGNPEVCDGVDNDCNEIVDDVGDADGDGIPDCEDPAIGRALDFASARVTVPGTSAMGLADGFTLEAWVRVTPSFAYAPLVSKHVCGHFNGFGLMVHGDDAALYCGGTNVIGDGAPITDGAWHHVAGTYDDGSCQVFADGILVAAEPCNEPAPNDLDWSIGAWGTCAGETYRIDGVMIWDHARTAAEIAADRDGSVSGAESGLLGWWRFDELEGQELLDSGTAHGPYDAVLGANAEVEADEPVRVDDNHP